MPNYDYRCSQCGTFEVWQKITEEALKTCPTCGNPVKRLIGRNIGIIFKGQGFYSTDNRPKDYADKRSSEEKTGSTPAAKTEDKKSDDKKADIA